MSNKKKPDSQPKGLYLLFFAELWERFGFYTLQTILILYMTKALLMSDAQANWLYAAFNSLLYLTPIIGGYLADRYLGFQRAIILGGVLFIIAYLICGASSSTPIFFLGLSILICANGFFKPNVSAIVGELYQENDPRRDGGFTLFYMGINIGALIPPLIAGTLVAKYGWHSGFLLAAAGMTIGQITFLMGRKYLGSAGLYPRTHQHREKPASFKFYLALLGGLLLFIGFSQFAFYHPKLVNYLIELAAIAIIFIVIYFLLKEPQDQRRRMFASLILIIISVGFWSLYNQAFTSLMLFADRNMDKTFLGLPFDAEATQFFNPFFIILLSPLLSRFWIRMDHVGLNPSTQMKFSIGILFMSLGYFLLVIATHFFSHQGMINPWWLGVSYLLQTISELLISPIGLAMITVLCPKHYVGMMMGVWFFSQAASFAIGGYLANIAAAPHNLSVIETLPIYSHAFMIFGIFSLVMTVISFALVPLLNLMIRGTHMEKG